MASTHSSLKITRLRHDFIFCIDPGFWTNPEDRGKRLSFTYSDRIEQVTQSLRRDHRVGGVAWARSVFEDARRRDHSTLTTINFEDIAPASVRLAEGITETVGPFELSLNEIRISRDGPIAFPFVARYQPESSSGALAVPQFLRELSVVRESAYRLFSVAAQNAFDIAVAAELCGPGDISLFERSLFRAHRCEIVDFDYALADGTRPTIASITSDPDSHLARELAGLIRMTRPEVWPAYRSDFITEFFKRNLGNRNDELWIFNSHCLVRHHPEEGTRSDVQLWFEDARLAMTILLQKASALEYLHWVMKNDLKKIHGTLSSSGKTSYKAAVDLLAIVEDLANRVVDPLVVERHVTHEFFRKLLKEAALVFEIPELSRLCRDRMDDIRNLVQAVAAQVVSTSSLNSAVSTERLTKQMLWLSILVAILAIAQILVAFTSF